MGGLAQCKPIFDLYHESPEQFAELLAFANQKLIDDKPSIAVTETYEGRRRLVLHMNIERNPSLVQAAKASFAQAHGRLYCEACGFDFSATYGERGDGFIEAHHRQPLGELSEIRLVNITDLAMVCSNCHRMLHREPFMTIDELRHCLRRR